MYKDDPTIFSFELINEASNSRGSYIHIKNWYEKVSKYFRSIDTNHLLTTGEIGYDVSKTKYSEIDFFYSNADFLFNGSKGTSFAVNSALPKIDYTSIHAYPESWNMDAKAGITWINDHTKISEKLNKPLVLGEFGVKKNKLAVYEDWLNEISKNKSIVLIVWQYLHNDVINNDSYRFNESNSPELVHLFKDYCKDIYEDMPELNSQIRNEVELAQNFPNPFKHITTIRYWFPKADFVTIEAYNSMGELVQEIEKGYREQGEHELTLSFDNGILSSGIYIYTL